MTMHSYDGPAIDSTYQSITERPELQDEADSVVYATDPVDSGEETTEDVPIPGEDDEDVQRPVVPGQTTLSEWGGSDE